MRVWDLLNRNGTLQHFSLFGLQKITLRRGGSFVYGSDSIFIIFSCIHYHHEQDFSSARLHLLHSSCMTHAQIHKDIQTLKKISKSRFRNTLRIEALDKSCWVYLRNTERRKVTRIFSWHSDFWISGNLFSCRLSQLTGLSQKLFWLRKPINIKIFA